MQCDNSCRCTQTFAWYSTFVHAIICACMCVDVRVGLSRGLRPPPPPHPNDVAIISTNTYNAAYVCVNIWDWTNL